MSAPFAPTGNQYTEAEDRRIIALVRQGVGSAEIGRMLDRSRGSIVGRIAKLRRDNRLGERTVIPTGYLPQRADAAGAIPAIKLDQDARLVAACLAKGGFPRAEVIQGCTYWLDHRDMLWAPPGEGLVHVSKPLAKVLDGVAEMVGARR